MRSKRRLCKEFGIPGAVSVRASVFALCIACAGAVGCRERSAEKAASAAFSAELTKLTSEAMTTYANLAFAGYADSAAAAQALLEAADALRADPSQATLDGARKAWIAARKPYPQTEVFRFYDGPIDRVETWVNTWPIDESFVEAGIEGKQPGLIENTQEYPSLTSELLAQLNMKQGETSISTGYHVIEFLLWGRDTHADGPGDRPFTDYVTKSSELARRRGVYLHLACELLHAQLEQVKAEWDPARAGNYRERFLRMPAREALALVVKGMGSLSGPELSGERLTVPYETKDQENEHSCFSDTTQSDVVLDALGIENVCLGHYTRVDGSAVSGPSVCEVIAARDRPIADRLKAELARSVAAARSIPQPFDQAILGTDDAPGRRAIWATIQALQRQTDTLADVAALFDLRVSLATSRKRP